MPLQNLLSASRNTLITQMEPRFARPTSLKAHYRPPGNRSFSVMHCSGKSARGETQFYSRILVANSKIRQREVK